MAGRQWAGEDPVEGECAFCGAALVRKYTDAETTDGRIIRVTEADPVCVAGHPQPLPQPGDKKPPEGGS